MSEPFHVPSVLFVAAAEEPRCRYHMQNKAPVTLAGVAPSGKPRTCTGVVKSIKPNAILHPGYPVMATLDEIVPIDRE
jgi:hypothetical protein